MVRFRDILRTLNEHEVQYVIVGGIAAVLSGAPVTTFDLDIVHDRSSENLDRLEKALHQLDAVYRQQPDRRLRPNRSHLETAGHQLLLTAYGPLDVLGAIGNGHSFDDLLPHATSQIIDTGLTVYVLGLEAQIRIKEELSGEKDLATLPTLRRVLQESRNTTPPKR